MNRAADLGILCVQKHIQACNVTKCKTVWFKGRANSIQVLAVDCDIDIFGQPGGHRVPGVDVHENSQPTDNAVGNLSCLQHCSESLGNIEEFFHGVFENS